MTTFDTRAAIFVRNDLAPAHRIGIDRDCVHAVYI
jgi:hypothetical protein